MSFVRQIVPRILFAVCAATVLCLLAVALLAVFVRAYAPDGYTIMFINQAIKCASCFISAAVFLRGARIFFQGLASGALSVLFTMLVFGAIGGFHLSAVFLLELLLGMIFGALGALCGKKLRKA